MKRKSRKKPERKFLKPEIVGILTLLILAFNTYILFTQGGLQQRIIELEEQTSIPNYAELNFGISHYSQILRQGLYFHKGIICSDAEENFFYLYIQNKGGLDTGGVSFFLVSPFLDIENSTETDTNMHIIQNLKSKETQKFQINFKGEEEFCKSKEFAEIWIAVDYWCSFCEKHSDSKFFKFRIS